MISPTDALKALREGNRRFVAAADDRQPVGGCIHQAGMSGGQNLMAIILACSDSRVPIELIFDQGLGDLFVIRVAGHVAAPSQIGVVEFFDHHQNPLQP